MSWLQRLIRRNACPKTHQKLAIDAIGWLQSPQIEGWREIILNYNEPYLLGAEAPDTNFRDYRNHVILVDQGYWGGLPSAAQLWYERLVLALRREFWSDAVYLAGVLGHYVANACMPLHTAESEEAGRIHRVFDWSVDRCYDQFRNLLIDELGGYPKIQLPTGRDWLTTFLRQCADEAHQHYHTCLDHFRMERAIDDPATGFDETLSAVVAQQLGWATVAIARVLDRAFLEGGSCPPMCELIVETVLAIAKAPARWVHRIADDAEEQNDLELLVEEAQRTGKVIENLREDQKAIRKLFAEKVLQMSVAELNSVPARPTGLYHGRPASSRASAEDSTTRILNRSGISRSSWSTSSVSLWSSAASISSPSASISSATGTMGGTTTSVDSSGGSITSVTSSATASRLADSPHARTRGGRRRIGRHRGGSDLNDRPLSDHEQTSPGSNDRTRYQSDDTEEPTDSTTPPLTHDSAPEAPAHTGRRQRVRELWQGATSRMMTGVKSSYSGLKRGYNAMSSGVRAGASHTVGKVKRLVKRKPKASATVDDTTSDSASTALSDNRE